MRTARLKIQDGSATYHVMSRVVGGQWLLTDACKDRFCSLLRRVEEFSGCRVRTHACMTSHWHILLHVPEREEVTEAEVLRRVGVLYGAKKVHEHQVMWKLWREQGNETAVQRELDRYRARMYDLSDFVKTLKQRFCIWYNHREGRRGTMWEERFKSVVVQESEFALLAMATYIDLNPVRAGIVDDPKEYRWSGYAQAVAGKSLARKGIHGIFEHYGADACWREIAAQYRKQLYAMGEEKGVTPDGKPIRSGISRERMQRVLDEEGRLSFGELLHCRVRYFSDGMIIGSKEFVNQMFREHRELFSEKRKDGARPMKLGEWGGLCSARALRLAPVLPPGG